MVIKYAWEVECENVEGDSMITEACQSSWVRVYGHENMYDAYISYWKRTHTLEAKDEVLQRRIGLVVCMKAYEHWNFEVCLNSGRNKYKLLGT